MPRYVDAELAKAQFTGNFQDSYGPEEAKAMIDEVPTADVTPVRHAHWEEVKGGVHFLYRCSRCGDKADSNEYTHCHCGAKMDEKVEKDV